MEHHYLETGEIEGVKNLLIFQRENNLDGIDNLDTLPELPAVYALCGTVNEQPANCRYVGESANLRSAIKAHFSKREPYECLRNFMQSIKTKTLLYITLPDDTAENRLVRKEEWEKKFKPVCNEILNEVH